MSEEQRWINDGYANPSISRATFSEMLEKHPEQEELLVKMLKAKLEALD